MTAPAGAAPGPRRTALETALRRDRLLVAAGLAAAVGVTWMYLVPTSLDMYGPMSGPSAWMMRATWDAGYFLLIFLMWAAMMLGMMLPSAAPTILLYAHVVRGSAGAHAPAVDFADHHLRPARGAGAPRRPGRSRGRRRPARDRSLAPAALT